MTDVGDLLERSHLAPQDVALECEQLLGQGVWADARLSVDDRIGVYRALARSRHLLGDTRGALAALSEGRELAASDLALSSIHTAELDRYEAFVHNMQGRPDLAIELLTELLEVASGEIRARIFSQLGASAGLLGDFATSMQHYQSGLDEARATNSSLAEFETLNNRAVINMQFGHLASAEQDLQDALVTARRLGDRFVAQATTNLGAIRARSGQLPRAIALFDESNSIFGRVEDPASRAYSLLDQAELLLDAGLLDEALGAALSSRELFEQLEASIPSLTVMELEARILANKGEWSRASDHAKNAVGRAAEISTEASFYTRACDLLDSVRLVAAVETDGGFDSHRSAATAEALEAHPDLAVDAGLLLMQAGRVSDAEECFVAVRSESSTSALLPLHRAVAEASLSHAGGDDDTALGHLRSGLNLALEQVTLLGVSELRAMSNRRVRQLATLGTEIELGRHNIDSLVEILEQERKVLLAPEPDLSTEERALLGRLRSVVDALGRADAESASGLNLVQQRGEIEHELRLLRRSNASTRAREDHKPSSATLPAVYLFVHGDSLHAAVSDRGTTRLLDEIDAAATRRALAGLDLALIARAGGSSTRLERIVTGTRTLLGPVLDEIDRHASAVVIPDPTLGHIPWALFTEVPVTHASSMEEWTRSAANTNDTSGATVIVGGPGLEYGHIEAARLSEAIGGSTILDGEDATAENVLEAFGRAGLVHFATHGRFRSDNPLVSAVELADGPLTFFDLLAVGTVPRRIVFSACDVGRSATQSSLGLAALLTDRGCRGFIASTGPANDAAAVELMDAFHHRLAQGDDMATALTTAQLAMVSSEPSVALFAAFGAG